MITIKRASNGWIVESEEGTEVFAESENEKATAEAFRDLLNHVMSLTGPEDSRYLEFRIRVKIEPGDKWESSNTSTT